MRSRIVTKLDERRWWAIMPVTFVVGIAVLGLCYGADWKLDAEWSRDVFRTDLAERVNYARYERVQAGPAGRMGTLLTANDRVQWYLEPARKTAELWGLTQTTAWLEGQIAQISLGARHYPSLGGFEVMALARDEFAPRLAAKWSRFSTTCLTWIVVTPVAMVLWWVGRKRRLNPPLQPATI